MPEGNTVRFFKDELKKFVGKTITDAYGKTKKVNLKKLKNQKIIDVFKIGKVLYIKLSSGELLQFHFLLFGSFQLNPVNKIDRERVARQLVLKVGNNELVFNTSSIKLINENDIKLDIQLDPTDTKFSKPKSKKVFKEYIHNHPNEIIADALMNQDIFPGVGNIIKNESLYLAKINPNRKLFIF
jgi:endonuclease-8